MSSTPPVVTLYSRAGCHLCETAEATLRDAGGRAEFRLDVVDVDGDPALADRYGVRVPVVAVDGVELFEFEVPPDRLLEALGVPAPAAGGHGRDGAPGATGAGQRRGWARIRSWPGRVLRPDSLRKRSQGR